MSTSIAVTATSPTEDGPPLSQRPAKVGGVNDSGGTCETRGRRPRVSARRVWQMEYTSRAIHNPTPMPRQLLPAGATFWGLHPSLGTGQGIFKNREPQRA